MLKLPRVPRIGVEEEYQIVDGVDGTLRPTSQSVMLELSGLDDVTIQHELHLNQIEMASPVLPDLESARACLRRTRKALDEAARRCGCRIVSSGTHPMSLPSDPALTPKPRYLSMAAQYRALADDLYIFGCHVHVDMPDRELGIRVMNAARPWLPVLQAFSANSPFWDGLDSGYASFRREMWTQWPLAGPPQPFADYAAYERCVAELVRAEAISDETKIYWDIRLPVKVPTIEFRIFDAMTSVEDVVTCIALVRALVMRIEADGPTQSAAGPSNDLLKSAIWQAARYGLSERLIDCVNIRQAPAAEQLLSLLEYVREPLEATGDWEAVRTRCSDRLATGEPATNQRRCFAAAGKNLPGLVLQLADQTIEATESVTAIAP